MEKTTSCPVSMPMSITLSKHFAARTFLFNPKKAFTFLIFAFLLFCYAPHVQGQSAGFNNTFIVLSLNGGANTYYDLNAATTNTDFNGANLGSFAAGSNNLVFKGAEHNIYKCGGADLTSTRIYYRIYLTSAGASGSFTSNNITYTSGFNNGCGGQDQKWEKVDYSTNLLSGLAPGNYSIQVYSEGTTTGCCGGAVYASNGGSNYTATFTVTGNYYSKSTGNLELTSSWGTNTDGTGNAPANFTTAGNTFNIRNNATPTIGASWTVSGSGSKIVVGDGTNACNFTVPSTFTVTSPTTEVTNNGTITRTTSGANSWGTLTFASGAKYVHNVNGGTLPTATWNANSTLQIDQSINNDQFTQSFGNVVINGSSTFFISTTSATYTGSIQGNFTHNSTGAISLKNTSYDATFTIAGDLAITGGGTFRIMESVGSSISKNQKVIVNGNFSLTNGTLNLSNETSSTVTASTVFALLEVKGNFTHTGGTISETASDADVVTRITLTGTSGTQNIESTGQTGTVNFVVAGSNAQCVVASSKTFVLGSGGMTISAGSATPDLSVNGIFRNSGGVITTTGTATFNSGGTYEHNMNAGVVPTATWSSGSTCAITGNTATTPTGLGQTFHHFTWNSSGQTTTTNIGGGLTTVNGNFSVINTGSAANGLRLVNGNLTLTVGGDLIVSAATGVTSRLDLNGAAGTSAINLSGNFIFSTAGTGVAVISKTGGTANLNFVKTTGTQSITQSGGTFSSTNVINLNIGDGTTTNTVDLASNLNLGSGTGTLAVLNNASLNTGASYVLSGSGTFNLNAGGTLITANTGGVNSAITTSTRTLSATANYNFNGSAAQVTGALLTAANNITLNNTAGLTLSGNTSFSGTLTFTNGNLTTNGNTLTLSNTPSGASASKYIISDATGTVTMNSVSTAKTLPIGTATAYAPLTVTAASATNYTANVSTTLPCAASDATKVVNLAWTLNGSNAPSSVTFQWPAASQAASFVPGNSCDLGRYNTACPYANSTIGAAAGSGPYTLTASTGFAAGNQVYVIGNADAVYLLPPTVSTTVAASAISHNAASSGGQTITGNSITAKGVVWDTATLPTVALTSKTNDGTGSTNFSSSLTSLAAETLYYVRAYVTNASGTGYGDEKTFRTLSAPASAQASNFSATATSSSNIDLSWTAATFPGSGATASGYVLLRAISPNTPSLASANGAAPTAGANTTIVSSTIANNSTSFSNSGLASATTYNYLIIPFTWDGTNAATYNYLTNSAPTSNATTNSGATAPILNTNAASGITAAGATLNGEITSDGGASVTARGFVYSSTDSTPTLGEGGVTDQSSGTGSGTYNESVSLSANTTYYFQAYATNSAGTNYGGILSFTTPKAEPSAQATSLVFSTVTTTSFNTAFTAASGSPDGYIVIRSTSASLSENPADGTTYTAGNSLGGGIIASVGTTISGITNTGLTAGSTYYTFVFSYNNSGTDIDYLTTSPLSSSVITLCEAPNAPSLGSITTTTATASWSTVTGASSYKLDVSSSSSFTSFLAGYEDLTVAGISQAITGLTPNTLYYARVRAVNASGTSASSSNGSGTTIHNAPTIGTGSGATTTAINANWTAPVGGGVATFTYSVELSTDAVDFSTPVATQNNIASGTTTYQFTGLTQGTTYYFRVKAVNTTGSSAWSAASAGYATLSTAISIGALGTAVTENFNGMGTSGTASTPTGIRVGTDFTTAAAVTTAAYGNSGTGAVTGSSGGGTINWADGVTGSATDRALGFLNTSGYTSPRSIVAAFKNNTGGTITNVLVNWNYEKYRSGSRAFDWTFFHGSSSAPATAATDGDQSYAADANNTTVSSPSSNTAKSVLLTGLSIADGETYYLRWTFTGVGGSSNGQGIGIDDLSIKGCGTVAAPTASNQTFCSAQNATIASLTATGTSIQWYAAATGGTALSSSAALVDNTTYYASQTIDGCESVTRTAVTVTITTSPSAPTGAATQTFCASAAPTVANLTATGTAIQWYAAANGGSPLSSSFSLADGTTYYASQTVSSCESATRLAVTAVLSTAGTWLGSTSTDWNTSANWCGGIPTASTNVVISSGAANYPDLSTGADGLANSITINSGASLTIGGTETLTITAGGSFTNNGTFTAGSGTTVAFAGTGSITGTATFSNITTAGALTPSATTTINGTLTLNSGGTIATNSPIFGSSSTLQYNYGGGFGSRRNQALEWPASNGPASLSITNGSWIQLAGNRTLTGNVTISNGALQSSGARTLTMNGTSQTITVSTTSGGAIYGTDNGFGNDLSLAIASGSSTTFTGDATSSSDDEKKFLGITINSGGTLILARGILCKYGTFTVNGTLQISANGYVQSTNGIAPTYGAAALLKYSSGSMYGRGTEWSTTSGAGYPTNVQISNNTTFDLGNGGTATARQCSGTLTVDIGSTLTMNSNAMSQALTIKGKFTNNGTTILSSTIGGDLKLEGDMDDNGLFTANGRAIFFEGGNNQTINSTTNPLDIDVVRIGKSGGEVILAQNLLVDETADPIQFTTASSVLNLNGYTATIGKAGTTSAISMNASSRIKGSAASGLTILGNGAFGTIYFDQTSAGVTNALNNFTIDRNSSGSITLANPIAVVGTTTITNGTINLGSNKHTAGALTLGSTAQSSPSSYGGTGSPAENINTTYFAATTGYLNVGACTAYSLTNTAASACLGSGAEVTLTNSTAANLPVGTYTVYYTLSGANTGSSSASMVVTTAGTGSFTTSTINNSGATTITINYLRNACVSAIDTNNTASITINSAITASVSISSSDADDTICEGTSVTFTATPTNGGAAPSYQWILNGDVVGNDSATYTTAALANGDEVTVIMTSNASPCLTGSPANSNTIITTVNPSQPASVSISSNDLDNSICAGDSVTFTATPTNGGTTPSYQWKVNGSNVGTNSSTYSTSTLANGDVVTVVLTSNASPCLTGSPATSNALSMTVNELSTATIASSNGPSSCPGYNVVFNITGSANATLTYNLNGGSNQTITLTGGVGTITVNSANSSQTLNLVSVDNGLCPVNLSESSTVTVESTTWNGTAWSNGSPTATKAVVISGNLDITSNLAACSIVVSNNATVSVASGYNVELDGAITVDAGSSFTLNSNANLLQTDANATNSGNIIVKRNSNPLKRLDYVIWSSPVSGQNLLAFSPFTSVNPTVRFYTYNTSSNIFSSVSDYETHTMGIGKGYLIRLPNNHPTFAYSWTGTFTGTPLNGTKTVTLSNAGVGQRYNSIGNPYPSTISMSEFYADNSNAIEPTIYFWRKTNGSSNPTYCSYNFSTESFVDNGQPFTENPNGVIQVGQGFIVEAKNSSTSVEFRNDQRVSNNANQMFRYATQEIEKNRIWLNLTSDAGEFAQMMVGYFTNGSLGVDNTDAKYFNDGTTLLSSKIDGENYVMNGRPVPFDSSDVVDLHYQVASAGAYSIAIDNKDGLFANNTQDIFLHDIETGNYHNLNNGPYNFMSEVGSFDNRFEIVYQGALSTVDPNTDSLAFAVVKTNDSIAVSASAQLSEVIVYDLRGRVLAQATGVNAQEISLPIAIADQVVLVKVKTSDGKVGIKKAL